MLINTKMSTKQLDVTKASATLTVKGVLRVGTAIVRDHNFQSLS